MSGCLRCVGVVPKTGWQAFMDDFIWFLAAVVCLLELFGVPVLPIASKCSSTLENFHVHWDWRCSMERTGDLWDTGAVDIVGSLMVITLKQVAIAHNMSDATSRRAANFSEERKSLLIKSAPSLLKYLSFMYAYGNLLAGPFNEYTEYEAFTSRTGPWQQAFMPGMFGPALRGCGVGAAVGLTCLGINRVLEANFNSMMITAPRVWDFNLAQRFALALVTGGNQAPVRHAAAFCVLCSLQQLPG
jgi:hypothetical protein